MKEGIIEGQHLRILTSFLQKPVAWRPVNMRYITAIFFKAWYLFTKHDQSKYQRKSRAFNKEKFKEFSPEFLRNYFGRVLL
jgi:hypothetical protein